MTFKSTIKKSLQYIFGKRHTYMIAHITQLAPSDLLKGRTALITGGTSGIGFAIAEAMLRGGVEAIVITGRTENRCKDAVGRLQDKNRKWEGHIFYEVMDNRNVDTFEGCFHNIKEKLGNSFPPISILCNNAGVQGAQFGYATEQDYNNAMDTNFKGVFFLSQLVARYMVDNGIEGNILNIASSSSVRPASNAYTLSKACIKELTAGMAKSLIKHGIIVNGLAPGPTATPMLLKDGNDNLANSYNPLGRYALPEEIGNMAVIMCSGLGRTIVGSIVYMTGGAGILTYDDVYYPFSKTDN